MRLWKQCKQSMQCEQFIARSLMVFLHLSLTTSCFLWVYFIRKHIFLRGLWRDHPGILSKTCDKSSKKQRVLAATYNLTCANVFDLKGFYIENINQKLLISNVFTPLQCSVFFLFSHSSSSFSQIVSFSAALT